MEYKIKHRKAHDGYCFDISLEPSNKAEKKRLNLEARISLQTFATYLRPSIWNQIKLLILLIRLDFTKPVEQAKEDDFPYEIKRRRGL